MMIKYRQELFGGVSDIRKAVALRKLLNAAVDAQNRHLECLDRDHNNMANFYSSINILCLNRLGYLQQFILDPITYQYNRWTGRCTDQGYLIVLSNVRDWRKQYKRVAPLGRLARKII